LQNSISATDVRDDYILTYSSHTSQSTAIFIPVYLFIARQSRDRACAVT